jgi:hypothetical protein
MIVAQGNCSAICNLQSLELPSICSLVEVEAATAQSAPYLKLYSGTPNITGLQELWHHSHPLLEER